MAVDRNFMSTAKLVKKLKQYDHNGNTGGFGGRGRGKGGPNRGKGRFPRGPDRRQVNAIDSSRLETLEHELSRLGKWVEIPTVNMIENYYDYQLVNSAHRGANPTPTPLYVTTNWTTGWPDFKPVPIMVDSGAAVYCVLGLEIFNKLSAEGLVYDVRGKGPTYVSSP